MSNLILNSLEIRRFRAFDHLQIERLGRVNLIVGKNNVGKTCLLEAIQLYARSGSPALIAELLGSRDESRLSNLDAVAINFPDLLPGLKYLFFGRREITNFLETIQIGPVNTPDKTLTITIGGFSSYNTVDDQGPRFSIHMGKKQLVNFSLSSSTYPRLPLTELRGTTCVSVQAGGLSRGQIGELWDGIALTNLEKEILAALQLIAPGTEGINLVGDLASKIRERISIVKIMDIDEPLPLRSLGDGMQRIFGIALALVNAKDGMLLIDEFENGIHYTVQTDLWRLIFQVARRLNVQVFATTHSWDCIEAFQKAAQEDTQSEGVLIRLESKKGKIVATLFDEQELGIATREQIEVR